MAKPITKKNFQAAVLRSSVPVVVDVWADWCGPCHALAPQFAAAEEKLKGKARFVKLDAEKNQKLVKQLKVQSLPTLLYFKDGKMVDRSTGVTSKQSIVKKLKPLLNAEDQAELKDGSSWWKFWE
jgi:thioredoxin 1